MEAAGCRPPANPLRKELYKVGPAYRLGNETDIMVEILTSGPVQGIIIGVFIEYSLNMNHISATMKVYQDFFSYESGIYKHAPTAELYESGYHSVRIIGWGEDVSTERGLPIKYWVNVGNSSNFVLFTNNEMIDRTFPFSWSSILGASNGARTACSGSEGE